MTLAAENLILSRGGARVLDRVSLALGPGEVVGLLGANGAGKSTLLGALAAELRAGEGALRLDGEDLSGMAPARLARRRAVLPQKPGLGFDLGVAEVVAMGAYPFPSCRPRPWRRWWTGRWRWPTPPICARAVIPNCRAVSSSACSSRAC